MAVQPNIGRVHGDTSVKASKTNSKGIFLPCLPPSRGSCCFLSRCVAFANRQDLALKWRQSGGRAYGLDFLRTQAGVAAQLLLSRARWHRAKCANYGLYSRGIVRKLLPG